MRIRMKIIVLPRLISTFGEKKNILQKRKVKIVAHLNLM